MEKVLMGLGGLLAVAVVGGAVAGIVYIVWLWWYGIVMGMMSFGVPAIFAVLIMIVVLVAARGIGALLLAVFGIWSGIWVLEWSWFWTCALYATTLTVMFVAILSTAVVAIGAAIVSIFTGTFGRN